MFNRELIPQRRRDRVRSKFYDVAGPAVRWSWDLYKSLGAIGPNSAAGRAFGSLGEGSIVCFPYDTLMNTDSIHIGSGTMISGHVALSAGWGPNHPGISPRIVVIGDRCLIGRGSSVVGHKYIEIGDDVWTGHHVHITDMNHGYDDLDIPISQQAQPENPVSIGSGSWLGHGVVVLPGSQIGRHVVVGAGSVVHGELPDRCVAAGVPAKVLRRYSPEEGWARVRAATGRASTDAPLGAPLD